MYVSRVLLLRSVVKASSVIPWFGVMRVYYPISNATRPRRAFGSVVVVRVGFHYWLSSCVGQVCACMCVLFACYPMVVGGLTLSYPPLLL